jgi:hypothetical protein
LPASIARSTLRVCECMFYKPRRFSVQTLGRTSEQTQRLRELAADLKGDATPDLEEIGCDTAEWKGHPQGEVSQNELVAIRTEIFGVQPVWLQLLPDRTSLKSCGKPFVLGIRSRHEPLSMGDYSLARG